MINILDVIMVGKTHAVIGRVGKDGVYTVVYSNGVNDVYEEARLEGGSWSFVDTGANAAYAKNDPELQEAARVLHALNR